MQRAVTDGGGPARSIGLGLFIVKHIVEAHGGRVSVASSAEHGVTFTLHVPKRRVREASHGGEALELLAELADAGEMPALILLDLMMPVMDGRVFLQHFRELRADIPVVVVTASGEREVAGAREVLAKPVGPQRLRALVREYCG